MCINTEDLKYLQRSFSVNIKLKLMQALKTFLIVNLLPPLLGKILLDNKLSEPGRGLHNYPLHTMETSLSNTVLNCQESKLGDN